MGSLFNTTTNISNEMNLLKRSNISKRVNKTTNKGPFEQDQTSKGRSFQLASCLPPLPAQRTP